MAIEYNKTNWVNNVVKLNAANMNHIEAVIVIVEEYQNSDISNSVSITKSQLRKGDINANFLQT